MGRDAKDEGPNKDILDQLEQLKAEVNAPLGKKMPWAICGTFAVGLGLIVLAGSGSTGSTGAAQQDDQTPTVAQFMASHPSAAPAAAKVITTEFDNLVGEFNANEISASRKYANARIRTKDYVSSISQDGDDAYASLDGGIEAYGSADLLATLHRGDEVQVTCDSASKSVYLHLKNCEFEVLRPADGFNSDIGYIAFNLDGNGGAAAALISRVEAPSTPVTSARADEAVPVSSTGQ